MISSLDIKPDTGRLVERLSRLARTDAERVAAIGFAIAELEKVYEEALEMLYASGN